jgi:16S rRNA (cytosine967-C5)-methyltransferase
VQDFSSQQTAQYFKPQKWESWWDACAASGGKSLLLHDLEPTVKLVVSDIRESILTNLDERFREAGILKYQTKLLDLTQNNDLILHDYTFDGIILDAPCSGSGTWGRTPEMISQFDTHKIEFFQRLQQSIARNVAKHMKPGKPIIYITCSVFKAENEDVVNFMIKELGLKLEQQTVLKGYENKADTMFVARLSPLTP